MFMDLDEARPIALGFGAVLSQPITYIEIDTYARLTGRKVRPHEVRAIRLLDEALLNPPEEEKE